MSRGLLTRRALLVRSAYLSLAAAGLVLAQPLKTLADDSFAVEELVDEGEALQHGKAQNVTAAAGGRGITLRAGGKSGTYTSRVLHSSLQFTHIGLHWSADMPLDSAVSFELRTSQNGSSWSEWQSLRLDCLARKNEQSDYFASLVYTGNAKYVQYQATLQDGTTASPTVERVTATAIKSPAAKPSGSGSTPATVQVSDAVSGRSLNIIRREDWGANESYRFQNGNGPELWPEMFVPAKKLVVHHTATRNTYRSAADAASDVRSIYYYHAVTQGWGDIGYCALIDKFGNIYEGRHGRGEGTGREYLSAGVVAGHDYHHNYGSAGVALLGDATQKSWPMNSASGAMWTALVNYSVFECGRSFIRPLNGTAIAASDFLRSDDVWTDSMNNVSGHRETDATTCPGDKVENLLPSLRTAIQTNLTGVSRTGVTISSQSPAGRATNVNTQISYTWQAETPEAGWTLNGYEYSLEGWSRIGTSEDLYYYSGYEQNNSQPHQVWTSIGSTTSYSFTPTSTGHYTFHVRAVLTNGTERRSAYEGNHTFLVTA